MTIDRTGSTHPQASVFRNASSANHAAEFARAAQHADASAAVDLGALPEWNLADLYSGLDSPQLAADMAQAEADAQRFCADYRGRLADLLATENGAGLAQAIARHEEIEDRLDRIMSYASLVYAGDTTNPTNAKFYGDTMDRLTSISSDRLFFALELNRLDDNALREALTREPLAHWGPWIEDVRREKPHQLEDRIEQLFLEKSISSRSAWNRLFDETMANARFKIDDRELALEPTLNLLQSADPAEREAAAQALAATFRAHMRIFVLITNTLAKDKEISDRWRGFSDVAEARHLSNRVEPDVVEALTSAVRAAYPNLSHRYYALKAKWFGKTQLAFWDRNAPIPNAPTKIYAWNEARDVVLDAYGAFSPRMATIARRFFDERWIDAPVRPGKAPGAFAHPTTPSVHPYVLLNYQGKPRDVMTLAHELGHGVHQVLAGPNGALMAPTPLTLAETASVFGEMLTFRALLDRASDAAQRRFMLISKVEDMLNTVVRQIAFYTFERKVHLARRDGELTAQAIGEFWMDVQRESLGPSIALSEGYETYWAYIPHFIHSPFYVYAYAFGDCLVNSLYGVYRKAERGFADKYLTMLAAGGSKPYGELLAPFGLDARDPSFWSIGLSMISGMIDELEQLEDK